MIRFPPALAPGDGIAVVAPSGPFEAVLGFRALAFLRERYRIVFDRGLFARTGYLAGDDARRRAEFARALAGEGIRAVLAARGGYGASRFAHGLDWQAFAEAPRWIVGFSDITVFHLEAQRAGVASIHGPHLTALGRADRAGREAFVASLESPRTRRTFGGLEALAPGRARGPLVGGNLTLVHATAAAGRLVLPPGAVLFLEDVTERPYRIDRMLTTLAVGGHFRRLGGLVLGDFTACEAGPDGTTTDSVLRGFAGGLGLPVVAGLRAGHGDANPYLVLGAEAELDADAGRLTIG